MQAGLLSGVEQDTDTTHLRLCVHMGAFISLVRDILDSHLNASNKFMS